MSTTAEPRTYTPDDLLAMPAGAFYELADGNLVEQDVSALPSIVTARLTSRLGQFCEQNDVGWVIRSECGYQCWLIRDSRVVIPPPAFRG